MDAEQIEQLPAAFVRWATSSDSCIPAGARWDDPDVLKAKAAFLAGRAAALEEAAKVCDALNRGPNVPQFPDYGGCHWSGVEDCADAIRELIHDTRAERP